MATFEVPGLHLNVKVPRADGRTFYRHYHKRGRGAVCIGETDHKLKEPLAIEYYERARKAINAEKAAAAAPKLATTLSQLFEEWRLSADYRRDVRSPATRRLHEDNIEKWCAGEYVTEKGARKKFGDMPYRCVELDWAKDRFLNFRDQHATGWRPCQLALAKAGSSRKGRELPAKAAIGSYWILTGGPKPYGFEFRETPKAADHLTSALGACLSWAKSRGKIKINPMEGVKRLYKNNRAAIIWVADNLLQLKAGAAVDPPWPLSNPVWDVVCLAALTGLAMSDLLRLTWDMVLDEVIDLAGGRKKTGVEAMPPILPLTRALLERLRREQGDPNGSDHVLLNSWGKPWTRSGFNSSFQKAKGRAGIGGELHFHDLRGTAATMFAAEGFSDLQIDLFMGWTEGESAGIRRRYLTARNVALALQSLFNGVGAAITGLVRGRLGGRLAGR